VNKFFGSIASFRSVSQTTKFAKRISKMYIETTLAKLETGLSAKSNGHYQALISLSKVFAIVSIPLEWQLLYLLRGSKVSFHRPKEMLPFCRLSRREWNCGAMFINVCGRSIGIGDHRAQSD
jgi:hypothetical protein